MKRVTILFILLFAGHGLPLAAQAGPLEDGFDAYRAGRYQQAIKLWLPLAKANNADAMFNLGLMYEKGHGIKADIKIAMQWYKRAAFYGSADAAYNLGVIYVSGKAGHPSRKDAIYWWKQAADVGHAESQYNLAVMYANGMGTRVDVPAAISLWEKAARQGQPESVQALVEIYSTGKYGVTIDKNKAAYWKRLLKK